MYNRYLRRDTGEYTRVPFTSEPSFDEQATPREPHKERDGAETGDLRGTWERLLMRLRLDGVLSRFDSSDLLLLLLILFLWREEADEEVLIALGLLLIL